MQKEQIFPNFLLIQLPFDLLNVFEMLMLRFYGELLTVLLKFKASHRNMANGKRWKVVYTNETVYLGNQFIVVSLELLTFYLDI